MHDDDVRFGVLGPLARQAVISEILADGREERFAHSFKLHAQHHDNVGLLHRLTHGMRHVKELTAIADNLLDPGRH